VEQKLHKEKQNNVKCSTPALSWGAFDFWERGSYATLY